MNFMIYKYNLEPAGSVVVGVPESHIADCRVPASGLVALKTCQVRMRVCPNPDRREKVYYVAIPSGG